MKSIFTSLVLLLAVFGLTSLASADTIFDSHSYLGNEAGWIAPMDRGEIVIKDVSVPVAVYDGTNWYRFTEEKSTNLTGTSPDFTRDYLVGEGGVLGPID